MTTESDIKQQVREFYNQVGWQEVSEGTYQNAHYEDLRPVAREYIHRCHMRVVRHIRQDGIHLLDAGSGPIQYPEYLEYSKGYRFRVCADISIVALKEARKRIGKQGLYVVADISNLPFRTDTFDGIVSLHTIHHLPENEHKRAYLELYRVLAPASSATVVNGWPHPPLMRRAEPLIRLSMRIKNLLRRIQGKREIYSRAAITKAGEQIRLPKGTFINRHDVQWTNDTLGKKIPLEIFVWRSVSVRFLRALIHSWLGGRLLLRLLFWLEERFPRYFGENGQYPLIVIHKP